VCARDSGGNSLIEVLFIFSHKKMLQKWIAKDAFLLYVDSF